MANFLLALFSLYFSLITLVTSSASALESASSSPLKPKHGKLFVSTSPKNSKEPAWFKKSDFGSNDHTWNVFGQWFNQFKSKPFGKLVHLKSITNVNDFWSLVSAKELDDVDRIDVSIFRPGFEPDFEKFSSSISGYILSYKVDDKLIQKSYSPSSLRRTDAKISKYMHVFDPLITAAMECEDSNEFPSEIIGFLFKRQYEITVIQIFVDGIRFKSAAAQIYISKLIAGHFPSTPLKFPRHFWLSSFSSKILGRTESGSLSARSSPLKIKVEEQKEEAENEKDDAEEEVELVRFVESEGIEDDGELANSNLSLESEIDNMDELASKSSEKEYFNLEDIVKEVCVCYDDDKKDEELLSYKTADEDEKKNTETVTSNLSLAPGTLQDQIFDIIFTEDFDIFLRDNKQLIDHFSNILVKLVLKNIRK